MSTSRGCPFWFSPSVAVSTTGKKQKKQQFHVLVRSSKFNWAQNYEILFGQRKCIFGQTIPVNQKECWNALHLGTEGPHFSHLEIKNKGTN